GVAVGDDSFVFGSSVGLFLYEYRDNEIIKIDDADVLSLYRFENGDLWVGTTDDGIKRFDKDLKPVDAYSLNSNGRGLANNTIKTFCLDFSGNFWIGTQNGAVKYYSRAESFEFYSNVLDLDENGKAQVHNRTSTFYEDDEGRLWIGMHHSGLKFLDRETGKISTLPDYVWRDFSSQTVSSFYRGENGYLWIGTWTDLYVLTPKEVNSLKTSKPINPYNLRAGLGLPFSTFFKIVPDSKGNLWMSTEHGILKYNPTSIDKKQGEISHYLPSAITTDIHIDHAKDGPDIIWVGTQHGLVKLLDRGDGSGPTVIDVPLGQDSGSLRGEFISDIFEDSSGRLWVLGIEGYINLLTEGRKDDSIPSFRSLDINVGNLSNTAESIEEDGHGQFWIGGVNLLKFNPETWEITTFNESNGLQNRSFKIYSSAKLSSGELVFGGVNGFSIFKPESLTTSSIKPRIVLEELSILGQEVGVGQVFGKKPILDKTLNNTSRIILPYKFNSLSISFAALHYTSPANNKCQYILEGYDKIWQNSIGKDNRAVYSNLPAGTYTFKVKGSNCDSLWEEESTDLTIKVRPPFARSFPAVFLYAILLLTTVWGIVDTVRKRDMIRKEAHLNEMKLKYFTDISHEIKTPLSLISAPINEICDSPDTDAATLRRLGFVRKNISRLTDLIEQVMDVSRFESKILSLKLSEEDLVNVCRTTMSYFEDKAESKDIRFSFLSNSPQIPVTIDRERVEKLLFNIIGNAFKFTSAGQTITVSCERRDSDVVVRISDTGCGIRKEELPHIFDRFYYGNKSEGGSGIGLALAKAIAEQHKGKIWAESREALGTTVSFTILLGKEHFSPEELGTLEVDTESGLSSYTILREKGQEEDELYKDGVSINAKANVLIAEDNRDLREYLKDSLERKFNITVCSNGQEAYNLAKQDEFDCIVSDIMMPVMDGLELCKSTKNDILLSHIPVILLTAKDGVENKLEGYSAGADDYITKPFDMKILSSRIENLVAQRNSLKTQFLKGLDISPSQVTITPLDEQFMQKCLSLIEENMSDGTYNVENLCDDLSMSRPTVYKKIKSLTGLSVVAFIRTIRMKRAAQLLVQDSSSIKNIMYMVGFDNSSYFSARFKKEFGMTPAEYAEQNRVKE
ncbi:MAG: response regulator, partial [Bacteroidales bacterium]|nr:response regulator [Bacteroidales bacterium]